MNSGGSRHGAAADLLALGWTTVRRLLVDRRVELGLRSADVVPAATTLEEAIS